MANELEKENAAIAAMEYVEDGMTIGLDEFRGPATASLPWSLMLPFRRSGYHVGAAARSEETDREIA